MGGDTLKVEDCFCGGIPNLWAVPDFDCPNRREFNIFKVQCPECERNTDWHKTEKSAVSSWNLCMEDLKRMYKNTPFGVEKEEEEGWII